MAIGNGLHVTLATLGSMAILAVAVLVVVPRLVPGDAADEGASLSPTAAPPAEATPPAAAPTGAPSFDTVRLMPDGSGLVAGQARPGATVEIVTDDAVVAEAVADEKGLFVGFLSLAPSQAPRSLSLRDGEGLVSQETVILAPAPAPPPRVAGSPGPVGEGEAAPEADHAGMPDGETSIPAVDAPASEVSDSASATAPGVLAAPSPATRNGTGRMVAAALPPEVGPASDGAVPAATRPAGSPDDPQANVAAPGLSTPPAPPDFAPEAGPAPAVATTVPSIEPPAEEEPGQAAVLVSDAGGVRVLQPSLAPDADAEVLSTVALDAIAYGGGGDVELSGRATGEGVVRLYLDNVLVAEVPIREDGTWDASLAAAEPGVYTLRVDQVSPDGEVASRIETPFQREARDEVAAVLAEARLAGQTIAMRTVQPGNTLWAIARERYGEPLMYVQVFEVNRDRIRDPDLIYPGQVFVLPATDGR